MLLFAIGLVPPAAALAVLGKGGGALIAVIVLMAITSSGSAEMVAVSSLLTYDIYRVFWNKNATGVSLLCSAPACGRPSTQACPMASWI